MISLKNVTRWVFFVLLLALNFTISIAQPVWQSAATNQGTSSTVTVNKPSGLQVGDLMVLALNNDNNNRSVTTVPSGWTLIRTESSGTGSDDITMRTYYKVATSSDVSATNFQFSFNSSTEWTIGVSRISGYDTSNPLGASSGVFTTGSATITIPAITTSSPNSLVLAFYTFRNDYTFTPPSGSTERYDVPFNTDNNDMANMLATFVQASAGSTGNKSATASGNNGDGAGQLIEIRFSAAPSNLTYPSNITLALNNAITPITPSVTGTVTSYAITPALPAGLTFNTSNGTISDTPTATSPLTTYTVTATNSFGSTTATFQLGVIDVPVIDVNFRDINFGGTGVTIQNIVSPSGTTGRVWYKNVFNTGTPKVTGDETNNVISVDAVVRVVSVSSGTTITNFDQSGTGSSFEENQQRWLSPFYSFPSGGGLGTYRIDFYLGGTYNTGTDTGTPVILRNVYLNTYDIDGNGASGSNQSNEFEAFDTYRLSSASSNITVTDIGGGFTRFRSNSSNNTSNVFAAVNAARLTFQNLSSIQIRFGGGGTAYFFLDFSVGRVFSSDVTDLQVTKTVSNSAPNVGDNVTYTITAKNNGPGAATGVTVEENLPSGLQFVSAAPSAGTWDPSGQIWDVGNLSSGQSRTLTLVAKVLATGSYANNVEIGGNEIDLTTSNNSATVDITPKSANLTLTKTATPNPPTIGSSVTFSIKVKNNGPDTATGVVITDVVPTGYGSVTTISNSGVLTGNTITWNIGSLNNGQEITVTFHATVLATGLYNNTASVTSNVNDPDPEDNEDTLVIIPGVNSDLEIKKTASNSSPVVGEIVTFTITVENKGPSPATGVTITDVVPNGYTDISDYGDATLTGSTLSWEIGNLAVGSANKITRSFKAKVVYLPNTVMTYNNTASVSSTSNDPTPGNNSNTANITNPPVTDLSIIKSVTPEDPSVGSEVTFTLVVTNSGPSTATGVTIVDTVPDGYTIDLSSIIDGGSLDAQNNKITWSISSVGVGVNNQVTRSFKATVLASGSYKNIATVSGNEYDPDDKNNTSEADPTTNPVADLEIKKEATNTTPDVGSTVTFTITITNNGPSASNTITITDVVPSGYGNITGITESGVNNAGTITWSVPTLALNASKAVSFTATVLPAGPYANTGTVSSQTSDTNQLNNSSTLAMNPRPVTDLFIVKSVSTQNPPVGSTVTFSLAVTNAGPSPATGVTITDVVPSGYTIVNPGGANQSGNTLTWTVGNLASGSTETRSFTATVLASGTYENTGSVTGNEFDPTPGNNSSTINPNAVNIADLRIDKSVSKPDAVVGDVVTYTITVFNDGPVAASGVTITDNLPSGLGSISNISGGGTLSGSVITWSGLSIPNGQPISRTYTATVLASGTYTNVATVTGGGQQDNNPGNNTDSVTLIPVPKAEILLVKSLNKTQVTIGETVTFTFTITNNGPSDGTDLELSDNVPAGYGSLGNVSNGGTITGNKVTWPKFNLANGATTTRSFTAVIQPTGPYSNEATVSGALFDPVTANNTSVVTPTIVKKPIIANDDDYTAQPINDETGNPSVGNVLTNDTLDGAPVSLQTVTLSLETPASNPKVNLNASTGLVSVAPGTPAGIYTITYKICEIAVPNNCDFAQVIIQIKSREPLTISDISGNMWYDHREDAAWNHKEGLPFEQSRIDETPIGNWLITLSGYDNNGVYLQQTTRTNADGIYTFKNIPEGEYRVNRSYDARWVPAFPLVVNEVPEGQYHIVKLFKGTGGDAWTKRNIFVGNERNWLPKLSAGRDTLYSGVYLYFDTSGDGKVDTKFFLSGPTDLSWNRSLNQTAPYELIKIALLGNSTRLGRLEMKNALNRKIEGELRGVVGDSLVSSTIDFPFELTVAGLRWVLKDTDTPRLTGKVSQMLPYNQKHVFTSSTGIPFYNTLGQLQGKLMMMEYMPLYGVDFATNQSIFGTAPDLTYTVRMEQDGARHVLHPRQAERKLFLGSGFDETQTIVRNNLNRGQSPAKTSSVNQGGVQFMTTIRSGQEATVQVSSTTPGYLHGWIDFNRDGVWDQSEMVLSKKAVGQGSTMLSFTPPLGVTSGATYARFRLCDCPDTITATGVLTGGEVEDYPVTISAAGGVVQGIAWRDLNGNGVRDNDDTAIANLTIFSDLNGNGTADANEPKAITNSQGQFILGGVPAGFNRIQPEYGNKWLLTNIPGPAYAGVTVSENSTVSGIQFGLKPLTATSLDPDNTLPTQHSLEQNYPNPFNPSTMIRYQLASPARVTLTVHDMSGRTLAVLVDREQFTGSYTVSLDASEFSSGVYIYRLSAGGQVISRKMTLIK